MGTSSAVFLGNYNYNQIDNIDKPPYTGCLLLHKKVDLKNLILVQ